ncbi:MAG TPA: hypothetical protein VIC26_06485 [Marinagarivorans sp.]
MDKRFLIIARVGDESCHPSWLSQAHPEFDLFLNYYGDVPEKFKNQATFYEQQKGGKWAITGELVEQYWELIHTYDAVWFPDDTVLTNAQVINRMFALFQGHQLLLAQPALTLESYLTQPAQLQQSAYHLRYVNRIDLVAPLMSREALMTLTPTFSQTANGLGLDRCWPELINNRSHDKIAIIDDTPVTVTRPTQNQGYNSSAKQSSPCDVAREPISDSKCDNNGEACNAHFRVYRCLVKKGSNGKLASLLRAKWQQLRSKLRAIFSKRYPS